MTYVIITPESAPCYGRKATDVNLVRLEDLGPGHSLESDGTVRVNGRIVAVIADRALRMVVQAHGPLKIVERDETVTLFGTVTIQAFNVDVLVWERTEEREYQVQESLFAAVHGEVIPLGTVDVAALSTN